MADIYVCPICNKTKPCDCPRDQTAEDGQRKIDVSNLRFYADLFSEHHWQTDVLHWSVFERTLREIAHHIEGANGTRSAEHDCGKFDASYVAIRLKDACWTLYCDGNPELNIEFCPYCGFNLKGSNPVHDVDRQRSIPQGRAD